MIFANLIGKFARLKTLNVDSIVSDILSIISPAQKIPYVLGVQVDATLDPGASPADRDAYILTDTAALNANFGSITGVGDDDIVMYKNGAFVVVFDASASYANDRIETFDVTTNNKYYYSGAWSRYLTESAADLLYSPLQNHFYSQLAAPGVNDDSTIGASRGSKWQDISVTPNEWYLCEDPSVGAAVWGDISLTVDELGSMALQNAGSGPTEYRDNAAQDIAIGAEVTNQISSTLFDLTRRGGRNFLAINNPNSGYYSASPGYEYFVETFTGGNQATSRFKLPPSGAEGDKIWLTQKSDAVSFGEISIDGAGPSILWVDQGSYTVISSLSLRHVCFTYHDSGMATYWIASNREDFL